jgi:hypothetical protein
VDGLSAVARLAVAALAAATLSLGATSPADAALRKHYKPCPTEDSRGPCVWDARHRGDGVGRSFVVTARQRIIYVSHARAHRLAEPVRSV